MKHLHTRICPICSKKLNYLRLGTNERFYCNEVYFRNESDWHERITWERPTRASGWKVQKPHYWVSYNIDGSYLQSCLIPPYWIRSYSVEGISRIYKFPFPDAYVYPPKVNHNLLMEVPIIEPSDYTVESFIKKIKNLVIFT